MTPATTPNGYTDWDRKDVPDHARDAHRTTVNG